MLKLSDTKKLRIELMNMEMKIEIIRKIIIADLIIVLLAIIFTR